MKNIRPVYCILVVFLLGSLGGVLATHLYNRCHTGGLMGGHGENREEWLVNRLDHELGLNRAQKDKVRGIVHSSLGEISEVRRQFRPRMEAIIEDSQMKINALLTQEQKVKFERMIAERKERFRKREE